MCWRILKALENTHLLNYSKMIASQNPDHSNNSSGHSNQLNDLFDQQEIQKLQDLFAEANGVASILTFPDGTPITKPSRVTLLYRDTIPAGNVITQILVGFKKKSMCHI